MSAPPSRSEPSRAELRPGLRALLSHPRLPALAALLGAALCLPTLGAGLIGDDYLHRAVLLDLGLLPRGDGPLLEMFRFMPGGAGNGPLVQMGLFPWWADFEVKAAFLRPLSAATHLLDHRLWPDALALHHLHSVAWYAAAVLAAGLLLRAVLRPARLPRSGTLAAAGLAALLFAVEDAHVTPAGWLANRNALVALAPGALALLLHLRGRRAGRVLPQAVAPLLLLVGLLAGESALGAVAYLAAWELCCGPGSRLRRLAALAPWGLVVAAWRLAYNHLGYGASGSGLYIDPARQPLVFAEALLQRLPLLQAGWWAQLPVDLHLLLTGPQQRAAEAAGLLVTAGVVVLLLPTLRRHAEARALALGSVLATVPLCAAFPMDRLLPWPGLGAAGLLALAAADAGWLGSAAGGGDPGAAPAPWRRRATGLLLVLHLPVSAGLLLLRGATLPVVGSLFSAAATGAPSDAALADQSLVFLNGNEIVVVYTGLIRQVEGAAGVAPRRVAQLGSVRLDTEVAVRDGRTLVLTAEEGFLSHASDTMFRHPDHPFAVGDAARLPDFTARVEAVTSDGRPRRVAFAFDEPLGGGAYRFVAWRDGELEEVALPPPGGALRLPATLPRLGAPRR